MSKREIILAAINEAGVITLNELIDASSLERKNLHDNLKAAIKAGLVLRDMDQISRLPCYTLTPKGREYLNNPALAEAEIQVSESAPAIKRDVAAEKVVIPPPPTYDPDSVCFDAKKREAAKDAEIEKLRTQIEFVEAERLFTVGQRNAWREMAYEFERDTPDGMREYIKGLQARITDLESNQELPLNQQPVAPITYVVADAGHGDTGPTFDDIENAKLAAIVNAVSTGKRSAVFAMLNVVDSVDVKWAA